MYHLEIYQDISITIVNSKDETTNGFNESLISPFATLSIAKIKNTAAANPNKQANTINIILYSSVLCIFIDYIDKYFFLRNNKNRIFSLFSDFGESYIIKYS